MGLIWIRQGKGNDHACQRWFRTLQPTKQTEHDNNVIAVNFGAKAPMLMKRAA